MRAIWILVPAVVATAIVATGLVMTTPSAEARPPDMNQVIRDGQVVEITDTTVKIREWAGVYEYRLSPTGRQTLDAAQIRPGDRVRFYAWNTWEIAYHFIKMHGSQPLGH